MTTNRSICQPLLGRAERHVWYSWTVGEMHFRYVAKSGHGRGGPKTSTQHIGYFPSSHITAKVRAIIFLVSLQVLQLRKSFRKNIVHECKACLVPLLVTTSYGLLGELLAYKN